MAEITARPDRLEHFTDTLIVHDAELAVSARSLWDTLTAYRSTNGDFGHDHRTLADGLAAMSRHLVELDERVGATAAAFRAVDDDGGHVTASAAAVDRHYTRIVGPMTDLRQRMVAISERRWSTLLYGTWACPPWLTGTYRGGGALRGPDGRLYPLTVPELWDDAGRRFHATLGGDPRFDPMTLGGNDTGWSTVTVLSGVARRDDEPAGLDRVTAAVAAAAGGSTPTHRWLRPEALATMRISPAGWPTFPTTTPSPDRRRTTDTRQAGPLDHPPAQVPLRDRRDDTVRNVDPSRVDTLSRPLRREFDSQYGSGHVPSQLRNQQRVSAGAGAVDLAVGIASGYEVASTMDHVNHVAYQIVLEEQPDSGRRRAVARTYAAAAEGGPINILPELVHVDDDGLQRTPMRFHHPDTPTLNPPQDDVRPSIVLEFPERES